MKNIEEREWESGEYIMELFHRTHFGDLAIRYEPFERPAYTQHYSVAWTKQDAVALAEEYTALVHSLARIARGCDDTTSLEGAKVALSDEDFGVWYTYIRPFEEPFDQTPQALEDLYFRRQEETLTQEEQEILHRHQQWLTRNCLTRLPQKGRLPNVVIQRARRYWRLLQLNAPHIVVAAEGRSLAEDLVLYHFSVEKQ